MVRGFLSLAIFLSAIFSQMIASHVVYIVSQIIIPSKSTFVIETFDNKYIFALWCKNNTILFRFDFNSCFMGLYICNLYPFYVWENICHFSCVRMEEHISFPFELIILFSCQIILIPSIHGVSIYYSVHRPITKRHSLNSGCKDQMWGATGRYICWNRTQYLLHATMYSSRGLSITVLSRR